MQVTDRVSTIERSATFSETGFKIKASAKAFKILSSGLYSDKIRAIVRELGTNAADSHVMAGKADRPFEVHLPNTLEPWFSIRDFGTGLSPQDIEGIYTTYFESNKTSSNDVTGCLGLGSKSPFSYTDNFTVTSYFNGTKYVYTAFMNEQGLPSVANLAEEDTEEENGVEVAFPVEPSDFGEFGSRASLVYRHFDILPVITGQSVTLSKLEGDYSGVYYTNLLNQNTWQLYRNSNTHTLVMGNVAYPVNLFNVESVNHDLFNSVSITIHCKIGEAEMTASREALEYTPVTKKTIQAACKAASDMWANLILADLVKQESYWEACLFYSENAMWLKGTPTWRGRTVARHIHLPKSINYSLCKHSWGNKVTYRTNQWTAEVRVDDNIIFIEDDLPRATKLRAMNYVRTRARNNTDNILYIVGGADLQELVTTLDLPANKIMRASAFPKIVRPKNNNAGKKCVYRFNISGTNNKTFWETVDLKDCPDGGIYVMLDKWTVENYIRPDRFAQVIEQLCKCGVTINKDAIYGVRKNILKKIQGNSKWISVKDTIVKLQQKHMPELELVVHSHTYSMYKELRIFTGKVSGIDISDLLVKIERVSKNASFFDNLRPIMMRTPEAKQVSDSCTEIELLKKKYPLVFYIMEHGSSYNWPVNDLVDYINLVNKV